MFDFAVKILILSLSLFSSSIFAQAITVAVLPEGGKANIVFGASELLRFSYHDWGPNWSKVKRKVSGYEQDGRAYFGYENEIVATSTPFSIAGSWRQIDAQHLAFEATLTPGGTSDLVMSQFSLKAGANLQGDIAVVRHADGRVTELSLPFHRGKVGDGVTAIKIPSQAGDIAFKFESPASIWVDRGEARIALAHGRIWTGKPAQLKFTLTLPTTTTFVSGPVAAAKTDAQADWYQFSPPVELPANSEIRMNNWLETPAGKRGRIAREGDALTYDGDPIKLWGINNAYAHCAPDRGLAERRADFYAAMGINSVRLHKYADGTGWKGILSKSSAAAYDGEKLGRMDYYISVLKARGIYTKLSPVFIADIGPADHSTVPYAKELGKADSDGWISAGHGAFYLAEELQDLLIQQVTTLLRHTNPHTGLRYADDPAIAYVELYNEDSALFGGINKVLANSPTLRQRTGQQFADWLRKKYQTEQVFMASWGSRALNSSILSNQKIPRDESWTRRRIYPAGNPWFFDPDNLNASQKPFRQRLLDTMAFLYDLQNDVYARFAAAIRKTGYEGELIASNWQAGRMMSHFYNLHSDSLLGTVDRHNYFGGAGGAGAINSASMLAKAGSGMLSSGLQQVSGQPFMLSEWIHVFPNEWMAEGPAIIGAYGMGLQGWDVSYPFQNSDNGTFSTIIGKDQWDVTAPHFIGMFPAVSRQVHRGDVIESTIVHARNVHIPSLAEQRVGFTEQIEQSWDVKTFSSDVFPAAALAVAKSEVKFAATYTPTKVFDLEPFMKDNSLRSSTGQLRWQQGGTTPQSGHITVDTAGTQAFVGFANGDEIVELEDFILQPTQGFGAIYLTAQSPAGRLANDSVLITAIGRARNRDQVVIEGAVLLERGGNLAADDGGDVVMEPVAATVRVKGDKRPVVHVLDSGGRKTGKTVEITNQTFTIDTGRDEAPYYLLEWRAESTR